MPSFREKDLGGKEGKALNEGADVLKPPEGHM